MLNNAKPTALPCALELGRRQGAVAALQLQLQEREAELTTLLKGLKRFIVRYAQELAQLYQELDHLEDKLGRLLYDRSQQGDVRPDLPSQTGFSLPDFGNLPPLETPPAPAKVLEGPETVKQLYRRAAARLHPDRARNEVERNILTQAMSEVNLAYEQGDRFTIERVLVKAGESPDKVSNDHLLARLHWVQNLEHKLRQRDRDITRRLEELRSNPMHRLWQVVSDAEARGLDPLGVMAERLRGQIAERRRELAQF